MALCLKSVLTQGFETGLSSYETTRVLYGTPDSFERYILQIKRGEISAISIIKQIIKKSCQNKWIDLKSSNN
jgi:hypothetical protein